MSPSQHATIEHVNAACSSLAQQTLGGVRAGTRPAHENDGAQELREALGVLAKVGKGHVLRSGDVAAVEFADGAHIDQVNGGTPVERAGQLSGGKRIGQRVGHRMTPERKGTTILPHSDIVINTFPIASEVPYG